MIIIANNNIKGITIEIGGNTDSLQNALKDVNKESKKTATELKEVERALKMDPGNADLLRQRQELLTQSIQQTADKLRTLRAAQAQVQQQFDAGTITAEQYRAFQREITQTEASMRQFEGRLGSLDAEQQRFQQAQQAMQNYMQATGQSTDDLSRVIGTRLASAIRDGTASTDQIEMSLNRLGRSAGHTGDDLQEFNRTLRNADGNNNLDGIRRDLERIGQSAEETEKDVNNLGSSFTKFGKVASGAVAGVGLAATGAVVGIGAFVESQTEMATDLARLKTNAETAGFSLESIEEGFKKVAAVSGEADSAIEAMSNLMATDMDEYQLAEMLDYVNGAAIKFSDTLKTEGIADGIQETFATGEAIGPFAELLERSGVDLKEFNKGLANAAKTGAETDYVLQQLSQLGLKSTYDAYLEGNKAITEYNSAQVESQIKLVELSEKMRPFITSIIELGNVLLDVVLGNKSLSDGFSELTDGLSKLVKGFVDSAKNAIPKFIKSIQDLLPKVFEVGTNILSKVVEGITSYIPKLISASMKIVTNLIDTLIEKFPQILDTGKNILMAVVQGIAAKLPEIAKTAFELILKLVAALIKNLPKIIETGVSIVTSLIGGLVKAVPEIVSYIRNEFIPKLVEIFKNTDWKQLGKDIIKGLVNGINAMGKEAIEAISGVVGSVVKTAKNLLGIKSPSRVFKQFGQYISQGLAIGIDDDAKKVENSIKSMVDNATDIAKNQIKVIQGIVSGSSKANASEIATIERESSNEMIKITEEANKKINDLRAKNSKSNKKSISENNKKIVEIEKKLADDKAKLAKNSANKISKIEGTVNSDKLSALKADVEARKQANEMNYKAEVDYWKYALTAFEKGSKEHTDILKMYNTAVANLNKEQLDNIKNYISDKKTFETLSLKDEVLIWQANLKTFAEGSKERLEVQKSYSSSLEALNNEIVSVNKQYQEEMKRINDDLIKQESDLNEAYHDSVNKRYDSLMSFASTFDEFNYEVKRSGYELTRNLESQISGIRTWQAEFNALSKRGVSDDLLLEISELGVKALPELIALNRLTDAQLSQYSNLYEEKSRIAREQSLKEHEQMRVDTQNQITKMRSTANSELDKLKIDWDAQIKSIVNGTSNQLSNMKQIGTNAAQGLLDGLSSMQGQLINKAKEIADAISKSIQSALDIHSPSRVMKGFGINIGEGLIVGMDDMIRNVASSSLRLSEAVSNAHGSLASSSGISQASTAAQQQIVNNSQNVDMNGFIEAIYALAGRPIAVNLDRRQIATAISQFQGQQTNSAALMRGVNNI